MSRVGGRWSRGVAALAVALSACADEPALSNESGALSGQVVVSGPLRRAALAIDQLDSKTGAVHHHVGDTETDADGRFAIDTGTANGLIRITARGGAFTDLATGQTIQLDATDELVSLTQLALLEVRDDALVSPVGHMVDARMRTLLGAMPAAEAAAEAARALHRHFGEVDWMRLRLVGLDQKATSPTEAVRAALVQAALSYLTRDIAADASASAQEVNVYRLLRAWADDVASDAFDGNDSNNRAVGSGLQLGVCPPVDPACAVPSTGCTTGNCRSLCDLYVGTPRALLGGTMTKVIRDNGPGGVNQTGLSVTDTLAAARSISDNLDDELFAGACVETLDRLPPTVTFAAPGPGAFVRGALVVQVAAVDDTDVPPRAAIDGHPDEDGDPTNAAARATIDTSAMNGTLDLRATAVDLAGNVGTATRTVRVDNLAPAVALSAAGFFVDGATWWTTMATPTLSGTVTDASPVMISVTVAGGATISGTVSGTTWTAALPAGSLDAAGTQVTVVAVDAAGNVGTASQRVRPDTAPPQLSFAASLVIDEAGDAVTFTSNTGSAGTDEVPKHAHNGTPRDLGATGCATITKYSYLLSEAATAYAIETPARNPLTYQLLTDDPGVGIAAASTQFRIKRTAAGSTTTIVDWTSAGAGVPVGTSVRQFAVSLYSGTVSGLATTPGRYDVEFRATDRLQRTATIGRCFELALKAPPLHFAAPPVTPTTPHEYALDSLKLGAGSFDKVAARLLNDDATGASVLDQGFTNGTARTVYLTVTVTKPNETVIRRRFQEGRWFAIREDRVTVSCGHTPCELFFGDGYTSPDSTTTIGTQAFPVKVFELVNGVPTTEVPCIAPCSAAGTTFQFAIPPRPVGGHPARQFVAMTMVGAVTQLRPTDAVSPRPPPYQDTSYTFTNRFGAVTTKRLTGVLPALETVTGCTEQTVAPDPSDPEQDLYTCKVNTTYRRMRMLTVAGLEFTSGIQSAYATASTAELQPVQAIAPNTRPVADTWLTTQGP